MIEESRLRWRESLEGGLTENVKKAERHISAAQCPRGRASITGLSKLGSIWLSPLASSIKA